LIALALLSLFDRNGCISIRLPDPDDLALSSFSVIYSKRSN